jgi:hypothetical protein
MYRQGKNFILSGLMILIFQHYGWITINKSFKPTGSDFFNQLVIAGIIGLVFIGALWLVRYAYKNYFQEIFDIDEIFWFLYVIFMGPIGFWFIIKVLPGWITITATSSQIFLMGILIVLIRDHGITKPKLQSSTTTKVTLKK